MLVSSEVAIASRLGVEVSILLIVFWSLAFCHPFSLAEAYVFLCVFQVVIVVGGRNFFCGDAWVTATGLERCTAYQVG